jgi:hypothetical protein
MKTSFLVLTIIGLSFAFLLEGQQKAASITFSEKEYDFGKIKEERGPQTTSFEFTNTGSEPLLITRVRSSCGCTAPSWSKEPIQPGGKGYVKATFNPRNMRGKFNKSVVVYTNGQPNMAVLRITGEVIPREKTVVELFPHKIGGVRLKTNHLAFARLRENEKGTRVIEVINTSPEPQKITFSQIPSHLELRMKPEVLKSGEKGIIEGKYDAAKKNDWGWVIDRSRILINDEHVPGNFLTISATIVEDFTGLSKEELENAAHIEFEDVEYNFGEMKQRESVSHEFTFTNTGKRDLFIRKVRSSCGCTVVQPPGGAIAPGESSTIKATFNSGTRKGKVFKTITVTTNDPKRPQITLKIVGDVLVPK